MKVLSKIHDSKIFNLWTNEPYFEIMHDLLVSVFDKVSKPKLSRFAAQYLSCNPQNDIFQKIQICAKTKRTSHISFENN